MSLNNSNTPGVSGAKSHFMKIKQLSSGNTNEKENTTTSPKRPLFFKSFSANSTNSFMSKTQESSPLKKKEASVNDADSDIKVIFNTSLRNSLRLASAEVKIKILEHKFSTPPKYGQDWKFEDDLLPTGFKQFSVHDVSGILRRYLNNLSEPLIPLACYNKFRSVLKENEILMRTLLNNNGAAPKIFFSKEEELQMKVEYLNLKQLSVEEFNKNLQENKRRKDELGQQRQLIRQIRVCLKKFEILIKEDLEDCNKQTLVYLLDLLFLFSQHSDKNLMTAKNLAAIFQPSMISHPEHDMNPKEYELSRVVLEFLVNFSYKILPNVFGIPKETMQAKSVGQGRRHSKSLSITMNDRENMELLRVVNKTESDFGDDASNHFDFENASPELDEISVITREE
ncbi:unnamed protein product [Hanseniaspora opuntiae]